VTGFRARHRSARCSNRSLGQADQVTGDPSTRSTRRNPSRVPACSLSWADDYSAPATSEHVGGHGRRLRFAESVHAGRRALVQTPYRYFPIEPHRIAPGRQFLAVRARTELARRWPLTHTPNKNSRNALERVLWTDLVDRTQMRYYFPDSLIRTERLAGLTKSLIGVRTGD
jgi:hypothetical protein